jgi:hypothetical protein
MQILNDIFSRSASSTNASKESSPVEPAPNTLKELSEKKPPPSKETKEKHDDFGDLMDYIMLDSNEREKHRVEIDRVHPVIQRSMEGDLVKVDNPTIAEMRKIAVRLVTYRGRFSRLFIVILDDLTGCDAEQISNPEDVLHGSETISIMKTLFRPGFMTRRDSLKSK